MAGKSRGRKAEPKPSSSTVKVTIRLNTETAQRLAVEAAMRRISMGDVVEETLGPHLRRWRLPSTIGPESAGSEHAEGAA